MSLISPHRICSLRVRITFVNFLVLSQQTKVMIYLFVDLVRVNKYSLDRAYEPKSEADCNCGCQLYVCRPMGTCPLQIL